MKPNFALNFTDDSITLLHRTKRGWAEVGSTPFDTDDLPAALADLRSKAETLAPGGITTKLVIPNSQIKYLTLAAPGPDEAARKAQIATALEGQTPYDVADLVWDHSGTGAQVLVAVLARETLDEAEGFAVSNGFNPVSFVAIPPDDRFGSEPFFGTSSFAETVLKPGQKVDREAEPIRLPEAALPAPTAMQEQEPEPEPETVPEPEPEPAPEPLPEPAPEPVPEPVPEAQPDPEPELPQQPDLLPEPAPLGIPGDMEELPEPAPFEIPQSGATDAMAAATAVSDHPPVAATEPVARPDMPVDPAAIAATLSAGDPPAIPSVLDAAIPDPDEAPMAVDVGDDLPATTEARARIVDPAVDDDLPPMPSSAALTAYSSRPLGGRAETGDLPPRPASVVAPVMGDPDRGASRSGKTAAERPPGARPAPKFSYETPGEKPPSAASKALRGVTAMVTAPSIPGGRSKAKVATSGTASMAGATATAGATVQGASQTAAQGATSASRRPSGLGSRPMPVRGKPRHLGLILTGILLIMLALAAGLSSYYVSWNSGQEEAPAEVAAAPEAPLDDAPVEEIAPEDEMLADLQDPAEFAADAPAPDGAASEELATVAPTDAAPTAEPTTDSVATAPAAAATEPAPGTVVAGDPAPATAPSSDAQDEIFLSAADTPPAPVDAAALAALTAAADTPPAAQQPPPPFGTVYRFDANGLILPTPEGIATPDGVMLFAGSPSIVPPVRPESVLEAGRAAAAAAAPAVDPAAAPASAAVEPEVIVPSDPALADARPLPRPAGLSPAPAPETVVDDGASLAPAADSRIATLRPAQRPETVVAAAAAASVAPAANPNGSLALVAPEGTVTPIGLAISRRPAERPQDLSRAVEEAVAAAIRLPDPEPEAPAAEITPETEEEPEVAATAAPRIPTSANVATQATLRNAINLRDMNLIGVYGTSSDRYALVRNPNGRYVRVEVGDRLDGGRVAAITASELRYEKRGRMVVLSLPNS